MEIHSSQLGVRDKWHGWFCHRRDCLFRGTLYWVWSPLLLWLSIHTHFHFVFVLILRIRHHHATACNSCFWNNENLSEKWIFGRRSLCYFSCRIVFFSFFKINIEYSLLYVWQLLRKHVLFFFFFSCVLSLFPTLVHFLHYSNPWMAWCFFQTAFLKVEFDVEKFLNSSFGFLCTWTIKSEYK